MMNKKLILGLMAVFICFSMALGVVGAYSQISNNNNVFLLVANDAGARFNDYGNNTYHFFSAGQTASQGLNALHLSSSSSDSDGDLTNTTSTSGTFYLTDTGGRGWDDDGVLMIAVNGTVPSNFSVQIKSAGYKWNPVASGTYPNYNNTTYMQGISETFTQSDFTGSNGYYSNWKPCPSSNYPIFENQNMSANNTFKIIFVDLYAGIIGPNTQSSSTWSGKTVVNNGALQVNYTVSNLPQGSILAFNSYAYCNSSNQGQGIRWTNRVKALGSSDVGSGYFVRNY